MTTRSADFGIDWVYTGAFIHPRFELSYVHAGKNRCELPTIEGVSVCTPAIEAQFEVRDSRLRNQITGHPDSARTFETSPISSCFSARQRSHWLAR